MPRRLICFVSCAVALALAGSASAELVGHWRLDDGAGTTAVDSTGNGHDGELIGNPQWVAGVYGGALQFAGTPDKVDIPYSDQLNPADEFSTSLWANADPSGSGHRSPITSRDDSPTRGYIIYVEPGNTWQFWNGTGVGTGTWNTVQGPAVDLGEWTHVAATFSNTDKKFYINGELVGEGTSDFGPNTAQVLRIGAGATEGAGNYFFVGLVDDVAVFDHALTAAEVQKAMQGIASAESAANPSPADAGVDVPRDTVLAWEPGEFAATHDVYFGTVFDDVNDASGANAMGVLVSANQAATTYAPEGVLEFGQTYYWRIDEVNAAPDNTVFKGEVWSFTVEPLAYPVENVTATSNGASEAAAGPENTINGSGLNANDEHSTKSSDMWLGRPSGADPISIQFEFDRVYKLHEMLVWNYNVQFELLLGFGIENITVEYSENGTDWTVLGEVELAQGTARADYTANTVVDLEGVPAQYVKLTVNSGFGVMGQFGLSEVRFMYIPAQAREPEPADGATEVSVETLLNWRAGRNAVSHELYLGTDPNALPLTDTFSAPSYGPVVLDLGTTYYWRVDEVNETDAVATWAGAVWSFTAQEYALVEDFESYTDDLDAGEAIFQTWIDGWENGTGSTVGHLDAPFAEQTIVHGGDQSMPLFYDNTGLTTAEAEYAFAAQDWTASGIQSLSLYFYGATDNSEGQLYVKINNTRIDYDGDATDVTKTPWQPWNIDLSAVGGNLSNVTSLTVGIEGAGATGVLYIDDIRLYPQTPEFIVPTEPDEANLVAHYAFEGDFSDSTGAHPGTALGDAQIASDPARGQVLSLDGTDDAVDVTYSAELNPEAFTASLWANPDASGSDYRSPLTSRENAPQRGYILYVEPGNTWQFWIGIGTAWNNTAGPAAQLGEWTHVAASYENEQNKLYINGRLAAETTAPIDLNTQQPLRIGAGATEGDGDFFFPGMIDEVRLYNRALSAGEVAGLAGRQTPMHKPF